MPRVSFKDLPKKEADAFRDSVSAEEPQRLAELSGWLQTTRGPWEELDATLDSLVPLWTWFEQFIANGSPGIPSAASAREYVRDETEAPPWGGKIGYGIDTIGHYLKLVCQSVDPTADWVVDRRKNSSDFQRTGIGLSNGAIIIPIDIVPKRAAPADILRKRIRVWLDESAPDAQERSTPVLPPPLPTPDPPMRWRPSSMPPPSPPPPTRAHVPSPSISDDPVAYLLDTTDQLAILHGKDLDHIQDLEDVDDLDRLDPLDAQVIHNHLQAHGFEPEDTSDEGGRQTQYWKWDGEDVLVTVDVVSAAGAVRYLGAQFEGNLDPAAPAFRSAATMFITLTEQLGARFHNNSPTPDDR